MRKVLVPAAGLAAIGLLFTPHVAPSQTCSETISFCCDGFGFLPGSLWRVSVRRS